MSTTGLRTSEPHDGFEAVQPPAPRARRARGQHISSGAYEPRAPRAYESERSRIDTDGVRTVRIRGQATPPRRRPAVPIGERYERHPDRAAQWALFMGVFMVVVAIITGS